MASMHAVRNPHVSVPTHSPLLPTPPPPPSPPVGKETRAKYADDSSATLSSPKKTKSNLFPIKSSQKLRRTSWPFFKPFLAIFLPLYGRIFFRIARNTPYYCSWFPWQHLKFSWFHTHLLTNHLSHFIAFHSTKSTRQTYFKVKCTKKILPAAAVKVVRCSMVIPMARHWPILPSIVTSSPHRLHSLTMCQHKWQRTGRRSL